MTSRRLYAGGLQYDIELAALSPLVSEEKFCRSEGWFLQSAMSPQRSVDSADSFETLVVMLRKIVMEEAACKILEGVA